MKDIRVPQFNCIIAFTSVQFHRQRTIQGNRSVSHISEVSKQCKAESDVVRNHAGDGSTTQTRASYKTHALHITITTIIISESYPFLVL